MTALTYPILDDEEERLHALRALELLDTPQEERFDRITRVAQRLLGAPMSLISLVDKERQWFKSYQGLSLSETPRSASFCAHAIAANRLLEIPDTTTDPRFADNPLVTGSPHLRFYAGQPLHAPSGHRIGTLSVLDTRPRRLTPDERHALLDLASWAELEVGVVGISRAVAERDRLRRRLEVIFGSAAEAICVVDSGGRISTANPAMAAMTGVAESSLAGQPLSDYLQGENALPAATPPPAGRGERGLLRRTDGAQIAVQFSIAPLRTVDDVGVAVAVIEDVSEQVAVERLKDEIISLTSHELRTPLTAINGSLSLVTGGAVGSIDDEARDMLTRAKRNGERLIRIVNDMLDLERLSAGRMPMQMRDVDLRDAVSSAVEALGTVPAEAGVHVAVNADGGLPVWADHDRLVQALTNLLANAVKFSPAGSTVTIDLKRRADGIVAVVRDEGPGIPADEVDRIFDRFTQIDSSGTRSAGGSGLGLAIARAIADAHGGSLSVEPSGGVGSAFALRLPYVPRSGR